MPYDPPGRPHHGKTFDPDRNVWVRRTDCLIAEKILDWKWWPVGNKTDFCGNRFHVFLNDVKPEAFLVLEPDTRVPNFSTNLCDAVYIANWIGMTELPAGTFKELADYICRKALS